MELHVHAHLPATFKAQFQMGYSLGVGGPWARQSQNGGHPVMKHVLQITIQNADIYYYLITFSGRWAHLQTKP